MSTGVPKTFTDGLIQGLMARDNNNFFSLMPYDDYRHFPNHYDPCPTYSYQLKCNALTKAMDKLTKKESEEYNILSPIAFADLLGKEINTSSYEATSSPIFNAYLEMWAMLMSQEVENARSSI